MLGLLIPNNGTERRATTLVAVSLPELHRSDFHGDFRNGFGSDPSGLEVQITKTEV